MAQHIVDIAADLTSEKVFWITSVGQIGATSFDGSTMEIVSELEHVTAAGIAVFEDLVYATLPLNNSIAQINRLQPGGQSYQSGIIIAVQ